MTPDTLKRWIDELRELRRQALEHLRGRYDALIAEMEKAMEEGKGG